jgi:hypothetical protein
MVERSHFSWIGPYCPALEDSRPPAFRERSEALVRRMGYQFRFTEVRHRGIIVRGQTLRVSIRCENEGVAPFYYSWPVELALLQDGEKSAVRFPLPCDMRSWLPGPFVVEATFEVKASPGKYNLALGCLDPWTNRPAIRFANKVPTQAGWTVLSKLVVE